MDSYRLSWGTWMARKAARTEEAGCSQAVHCSAWSRTWPGASDSSRLYSYVVSKGRARRGKVFRVRALAVREELKCQGLAAKALGRLQEELAVHGDWNEVQASAGASGWSSLLHGGGWCRGLCQTGMDRWR